MESAALPRYVVLQSKSNSKYLSCGKDGSLKCNGEEATSANCKFFIHTAEGYGSEYFYMRSVYNNKYVSRADGGGYAYYVAESSNLGELFCSKPTGGGGGDTLPVIEIGTGQCFVDLSLDLPPPRDLCLVVGGIPKHGLFKVIDWESLVVLPRHVAFKACNGTYLGVSGASISADMSYTFVQCGYHDIDVPRVAYEIISKGDGSVCIRSKHLDAFWGTFSGQGLEWISVDRPYEESVSFVPVKVGDDTVALRCLDNNLFCGWASDDDVLKPNISSITREGTFTVEEVILSRSIYDVKFRINDARIYDEQVTDVVTEELENYSPTQTDTLVLKKKYTKTTTRTWNASVSLKLGYSPTVKAAIPLIGEAGITTSAELQGSYSWGEAHEESEEAEADFTVPVPPMHKARASLIATRGTCDVPFSYTQKDHLRDGTFQCHDMDDGVFTGINSYNFHYVHTEEPLPVPPPETTA